MRPLGDASRFRVNRLCLWFTINSPEYASKFYISEVLANHLQECESTEIRAAKIYFYPNNHLYFYP